MKVFIFFVLFSLIYSLESIKDIEEIQNYKKPENETKPTTPPNEEIFTGPLEFLFGMLKEVFTASLNKTRDILSEGCVESIEFTLQDQNLHYLRKFIEDSANNKNDMDSYLTCTDFQNEPIDAYIENGTENFNMKEFAHNLTFAVLQVNKKNWVPRADIRYLSGKYLLGICITKGCSEEEYRHFLFQMNKEMKDPLKLRSEEEIIVFDLQNHTSNYDLELFLSIIPVYLMLLQLFFTCFPQVPALICCCCFRKKHKKFRKKSDNILTKIRNENKNSIVVEEEYDEEDDDYTEEITFSCNSNESMSINKNIDKKIKQNENIKGTRDTDEWKLHQFKSCFDITDNTDEFFSLKTSKGNNESGMSSLRGLRGFSMIFMIIGHIYLYLLISPLKIYSEFQHKGLMTSNFYGIILFGMRYAPRVLIACSGFSLLYKLLCYLDEIVENSQVDLSGEESMTQRSSSKFNILKEQELFIGDIRKDYPELKYIHLVRFILYQGYKYILFVLFVCYYKYSFYELINLFYDPGPMWVYLKRNIIDQLVTWDFYGTIFLFYPFANSNNENLNLFWIPLNEITFFLITTVIVFFSYKKNFRMDLLLFSLWVTLLIFKMWYYFTFQDPKLFPILGNYADGNANFYLSPVYNYTFFITGVFFGAVNYVIQKSVNKKSISKSGKTYLNFAVCFVKFFKENRNTKVIAVTVFGIASVLFLTMSYPILYAIIGTDNPDKYLQRFNSNQSLNIFYLLDTELFINILLIVFTSLFILGDNFFVDFFTHDYWSFISRSYYSFILICDMVIVWIFYQSESRIKLEIFNILFFSLFTVSLIVIVSIFSHIILEMPYKKLNKNLWGPLNKSSEDVWMVNITKKTTNQNRSKASDTLFSN